MALDPSRRINLNKKTNNIRLSQKATKYRKLLAHRKPEKSPGESRLSPGGFFRAFPRMLCIRVGVQRTPGQKHNVLILMLP